MTTTHRDPEAYQTADRLDEIAKARRPPQPPPAPRRAPERESATKGQVEGGGRRPAERGVAEGREVQMPPLRPPPDSPPSE